LVLVNKQQLYDQWISELNRFLDIENAPPERETPSGRKKKLNAIGEYCGTKHRISGLVDVAMMQSLYSKGEPPDFIKDYGMVIVDEAHHAPAGSFETVLQHANASYIYGLTATPARKDGRQPILFLECGPIRFKTDAKEQAVKRPFEHYIVPRFTGFQPTSVSDEQNWGSIVSALVVAEDRNQMIVDDVLAVLASGRNPIVLSERKEHVLKLAKMLDSGCENVITLIGGRSAKERHEASGRLKELPFDQPFVIVGTGQLVGEGFDYPRLDTLFITLPISWKGKVAQYLGRLHRIYDGKEDVRIYDYIDTSLGMLENMYRKRLAAYKANGYCIAPRLDGSESDTAPGIIFSKDDYWETFWQDCMQAQRELVVASPRIADYRAKNLITLPLIAQKDVVITVYTQGDEAVADEKLSSTFSCLEQGGIKVVRKQDAHHCLAIIDQSILWYGNINLLSYASKHDAMIRIDDATTAKRLLLEVNEAFRQQKE
jgi:superfamily II DNA or RNA helicase